MDALKERIVRWWMEQMAFGDHALYADCSIRSFFQDGTFEHPSVIFAIEQLDPLEPEEVGIFSGELVIRITSLMDVGPNNPQLDPEKLHTSRVAIAEGKIGKLIESMKPGEGFVAHHYEFGKTEKQIAGDRRLYSDLISVGMIVQGCVDTIA